ncbi:TonB-dependent receptor plug domain-containing protein [Flavicella sediminum]|uniref:TonB-dependent receptor plug domain-containing protein n=1 Tax=Flavicella sediminum TaxID=2585141 RepID=UPI00111DADA4|nr:TonB-dependent receptor [Flavicella sediminum]
MEKYLIFFMLVCASLSAQKLTVLGSDSGLPIKGVSVSNKDKSLVVYTDINGQVDLSAFDREEFVFFYHYLYIKEKEQVLSFYKTDFKFVLEKITERLEEVVLSVSRVKENNNRIAEQTVVLTSKDIKRISPQTTADLLAKSPGIKIQKTQFGGGSPVLRGLESNRVLLVVDGVRMNNAIYRKGHLQNAITVSPSILDRVEVVFGPSSVIYGSDALGGVIHYYTKKLKTSEYKESNSSIFSRVSSVNNEITTQFDTEMSFSKWAFYTNLSYSKFGDLKMGKNRSHGYDDWGKVFNYSNNTPTYNNNESLVNSDPNLQKNTGYSQFDFLQKVYLPVSNDTELMFNFQYSESSNIPRFDRLTERSGGDLKFAEWYYGPQTRMLFSTQLEFEEISRWIDKGTVTLAFQDIDESRVNRKLGSLDRTSRFENVNVFSINADFSVALTEKKNKTLSYGFEVVYNKVNSTSKGEQLSVNTETNSITGVADYFDVLTRYPDGGSDYFTQAMYVGYRQDLDEKHTLNTGLRFTNTQLNAFWGVSPETDVTLPDVNLALKNSAVTATIGHIYKPKKATKISMVLSSGFRSPNIDDIGKIREKSGAVTVPNVNLKPEYAYNSEFGIKQYFNHRLFSVGFNVYYTLLYNYIIRAPFDIDQQKEGATTITFEGEEVSVFANVNRGNAFVKGGTFSFHGEINEHWETSGDLTFTKGKTYDSHEPLSSIPPLFGSLSFVYKVNKLRTGLNYIFNATKNIEDYNLSEGIDNVEQTPVIDESASTDDEKYAGTPRWQTLNYSLYYELNRNIDLQIKVDNIFDEHYKEFASGISAPGRNFTASMKYIF